MSELHLSIDPSMEMLTESSDDTAEQEKDLEMEITRLESETLEERNQRKEEEEDRKKEEAATKLNARRRQPSAIVNAQKRRRRELNAWRRQL